MPEIVEAKKKINHRMQTQLQKTKSWFEKNEKYLSTGFFFLGFLVDSLTLTRVDLLFDNLVLLFYLTLATVGIILLYFVQTKRARTAKTRLVKFSRYLPLLTQYAFGGLFSGYIIFYSKSASWAVSWVFLLLLLVFFIGNERFRRKYKAVDFQVNILFVVIFSFLIFFLPVVLKTMGTKIFLLSGLLSLGLIYLLICLLSFISNIRRERKIKMAKHILGVFFLFNALYFLNIIPPIPLALKEIGLYDFVQKTDAGGYLLVKKELPWYARGNFFLEISPGPVYVYQAIFAPTDLNTEIYNLWQKFDENKGEWVSLSKIYFSLQGGRTEGYRGYTFLSNVTAGLWRVDVRTTEDLVIGRVKFRVVE